MGAVPSPTVLGAAGLRAGSPAKPMDPAQARRVLSGLLKEPGPVKTPEAFPRPLAPRVPREFKGRLTDAHGSPLDGTFLLKFSCPGGEGRLAWAESLYVHVRKGVFRAILGRIRPIPAETAGGEISAAAPVGTGWRVLSLAD